VTSNRDLRGGHVLMLHGIKTARAVVKRNRESRTVGNDFLRKAKGPKAGASKA
jgi:hypothetical protein